jgi:hypothetical protein
MKTKHGFLFGIAVLLVAAMFTFTLAGCDNGSTDPDPDPGPGPGPSPETGVDATISLKNTGTNTFTLTLTGATWKPQGSSIGTTTIDYTTRHESYYIQTVGGGNGSAILHWVNEEGVPVYLNLTVARTSDTVLTITAVKDTSRDTSSNPANTGSGAITLWDNTHWAEEMTGIESRTWGAYFLFVWTNESKRETLDADLGTSTYLGTLTVTEGSGSVPITIN